MKIEIDGKEIEAEAGKMIIQVADQHSIPIPRFCYHNKLSIAANCRMCLVQVEKSGKPLPACATPIAEGMKIWTTSEFTKDAQRSVMEFLLINHPLDCPICDQGGECELQDVSMQYGADNSRFEEPKRVVVDEDLGSLIASDMTRCIQCTRCVRFGTEIAGDRELGATGRSEAMRIETFLEQHVNSEVSGNIIDLCPVGALTSKPFRFKARAWELEEHPFVAPHDCIGSNINVHLRRDEVMRIVPRDAEKINEIWLSDRDRFSYEAMYHAERLRKPMINRNGKWQIVSWVEAINFAIAGIRLTIDTYGANEIGSLASPNSTLEEFYLLQRLTRAFGSPNVDHRLRQLDFIDQELAPLFPNLGLPFADLEQQNVVLLIGSDLHKEQPIAALKLRKITERGGIVCAINPVEFEYNFDIGMQIVNASDLLQSVAAIAKELWHLTKSKNYTHEIKLLENLQVTTEQQQLANKLLESKALVLLGQHALMHPQVSEIRSWANMITELVHGKYGEFTDGANSAGAWLAGCVPHRTAGGAKAAVIGKNAFEMLEQPMRAYILLGTEPDYDSVLGAKALESLHAADFVVAITGYQSDSLLKVADVLLPMAVYAENTGTFVNTGGVWQNFHAAVTPFGESRPAWRILRVLGNVADLPDFNFETTQEIRDLIYETVAAQQNEANVAELGAWLYRSPSDLSPRSNNASSRSSSSSPATINALTRIAPLPLYSVDAITRRATALQATKDARNKDTITVNPETAKQIGIIEDSEVQVGSVAGKTRLTVKISSRVPEFTAVIYQAQSQTNMLGLPYSVVEVKP